jgi:predicted GNAT family acetyltransferase
VRTALDYVRAQGLKVLPLCPYAKAWIGRHPEYQDLLD